MKRILFCLLVLVLVVSFASCGNNDGVGDEVNETHYETETNDETKVPEETEAETEITIGGKNINDYYKVVQFDLPEGSFRDAVVAHMREQASIEWVCSETFGITEDFNSWGIHLQFKKGEKYVGIPYADTKVSAEQFRQALVDGTYTCQSDKWKDVYGVQCVSSIYNSIQQVAPNVYGTTYNMTPGIVSFEFRGIICGQYEVPKSLRKTQEIIDTNSGDVMCEAYAQLKKGDVIIMQDLDRGAAHTRLVVEDAVVLRNAAGKINKGRSYVQTIEQTNSFDAQRTDGVKTTWYVDHKYSFDKLIQTNYVPVTFEIYNKDRSECEAPYLLLDKEITPKQIEKGAIGSNVESNFPIRYVYLDLYSKDGKLVKREMKFDMADEFKVILRKPSIALASNLEKGEYTFVLTAGIARGSAELARVDFTVE